MARTVLRDDLVECSVRGDRAKVWVAGEGVRREGMDAMAAARQANPWRERRHELAHAG